MSTKEERAKYTQEIWIQKYVHEKKGNPKKKSVKAHKFTPCRFGTSDVPEKYKPSYSKIGNDTLLSDPDNCMLKHKIEIVAGRSVWFNDVEIVVAPVHHNNRKKYTAAQQLQFCKAVVYSIIPGEIKALVTNKHGNKVYESVPDDAELRRYIALYPAVMDNQCDDVKEEMQDKILIAKNRAAVIALERQNQPEVIAVSAPSVPVIEDLVLPEVLNAYTHEGITGYPSAEEFEDLVLCHSTNYEIELEDLERELFEGYYESCTNSDNGSKYDSLSLENEYNNGEEVVLYDLIYPVISPVIIRTWNHGTMKITEEVYA